MGIALFSQKDQPMGVSTRLGPDALRLEGFTASEAISEPFLFEVDLLADRNKPIPFEKLLGEILSIRLAIPKGDQRYFNGVVSRLTQSREMRAPSDAAYLIRYRAEVVPKFWLLKQRFQSRIFQQQTVEEILKTVLNGLDVSFELHTTLPKRDYCVQYRESDFDFASRLMEEEGIYYYFKHTADAHKMVLALTPDCHTDVPAPTKVAYEVTGGGSRKEEAIYLWQKTQQIRSGKYILRDHCFEMPDKDLEAQQATLETVHSGKIEHKLKLTSNEKLEIYDFPGGYAKRFDGVAPGGGDRAADLQKIFDDSKRTAAIRMKQETAPALEIVGKSRCRQFSAGHKFKFETDQQDNDDDGTYVLTRVKHEANLQATHTTHDSAQLIYKNGFHCIPSALPFRPPRLTPKARVEGPQTAVVVGPAGEEVFTDKYGRVKVQFFWDRQGKHDAGSSCWVRVGTLWAGQQWGAIHIPRIGQEVIVAFEEGDPDQPIIVGSVYNAKHMPPYKLPDNRTQSGLKSRSTLQGSAENFNELRFEDKKGSEDVFFQAEKDFHRNVKNDDDLKVGHDQTIEIKNNRTEKVIGKEKITISKGREVTIDTEGDKLTVSQGDLTIQVNAGQVSIEAMTAIELKVGMNSIKIDPSGVQINGANIKLAAEGLAQIGGMMVVAQGEAEMTLEGGLIAINP
jgi:type VI secretion system secreted protein VgrG